MDVDQELHHQVIFVGETTEGEEIGLNCRGAVEGGNCVYNMGKKGIIYKVHCVYTSGGTG